MKRFIVLGCVAFGAGILLTTGVAMAREFGGGEVPFEIQRSNAATMKNRPDLYKRKCQDIAADPFAFLRGTAHLMYQDIAKSHDLAFLNSSPQAMIDGDLHIHNFSVLYFPGKKATYGIEDLDEAHFAPMAYDLFRMCVSISVAFEETLHKGSRKSAIDAALNGYERGLQETYNPDWPEVAFPKSLRKFVDEATKVAPDHLLKKMTEMSVPNRFRLKENLLKLSEAETARLNTALSKYLNTKIRLKNLPRDFANVSDVVAREDKGLSSIGLKRYFVLIDGSKDRWEEGRILEIKEMRPSSVGPSNPNQQVRDTLTGLMQAHRDRDVFLGTMPLGGKVFLVRELFPWTDRIESWDWGKSHDIEKLSEALGAIVADFHAAGNRSPGMTKWLKENRDSLIKWSEKYAEQVKEDWQTWQKKVSKK